MVLSRGVWVRLFDSLTLWLCELTTLSHVAYAAQYAPRQYVRRPEPNTTPARESLLSVFSHVSHIVTIIMLHADAPLVG